MRRPASDTRAPDLQHDHLPVVRALHIGLGQAAEHVRAHVGENDSPAVEALTILTEGLVVEVVLDLLLEEVRLADEEVSPACGLDQALGPFGVAGVGDHLPAILDAQGVGGGAAGVL